MSSKALFGVVTAIVGCSLAAILALREHDRIAVVEKTIVDDESDEEEENSQGNHVYKIVLTGGPCAGKTTALARLSGFLSERGFRVFTVPEAATMLFVNGASLSDLIHGGEDTIMAFQRAVLDSQITLEDCFVRVAASLKKRSVLLCDRGAMDGAAYMSKELWHQLLDAKSDMLLNKNKMKSGRKTRPKNSMAIPNAKNSVSLKSAELSPRTFIAHNQNSNDRAALLEQKICERYDAIFHLVTAAEGAERFYTLENNAARTEDTESARQVDYKTQRVWAMHPRHIVFDNSASADGFEGKLQRVVEKCAHIVGLPVLPKGTRKFKLIQLPPDEAFAQHQVNLTSFLVTKTFLKPPTTTRLDTGIREIQESISDQSQHPPLQNRSQLPSEKHNSEQYSHSYVRVRWQADGSTTYGHVTVHIDPLTLEVIERKRRCTPREYTAHLNNADPNRRPVQQRRLHFLYKHQSFVIHQYLSFDSGDLAIIHCQAARKDDSVDFPPFLQVGKEITEDRFFSAYNLSQLSSLPENTAASITTQTSFSSSNDISIS
mmetsp:Transcript_18967/g.28629  ORF Transcript_18967/g.28629 Transcript_18967/m.28629 type:complete len:545 (-) Transcript_18967:95-1729(-)|eukprot:CAMPEP_0197315572 /NCGR_PEP_ID=MMETSP0891-20130614/38847_1 /TAXON_ID=44058 ORGANISM="Aureoumbra lagunensis, Strain CCMP1510" /NCGR_SAMPLE_ID=MMETSP0891 /ASSEMBLY_ACC=CAM_ASM_000534 /LENGTH=544 /DNA_ID=CAMNT_0042804601 /DNA_START=27 /DNA_END=1661 /DNA_ORIENTATION=+